MGKTKKEKLKAETHADVKAKVESKKWFYTDLVKEHFFNPKNFLKSEKVAKYKADGGGSFFLHNYGFFNFFVGLMILD